MSPFSHNIWVRIFDGFYQDAMLVRFMP